MSWWGWIIFGTLLLGSELLVVDVGFYLVFVGIAAALIGVIDLFGLTLAPWAQWLVFAAISAMLMVLFRKKLYDKLRSNREDYDIGPAGDMIRMEQSLAVGEQSRMSFRGTSWNVINTGNDAIEKGSHVRIESVEGLTLKVNQSIQKT